MQLDAPSAPSTGGSARRPLRVKNREPNATVFSKQINGDPFRVQFAAAGYPGDTQRVPTSLAEDIDFLNSLEAGVLEVVDGPPDVIDTLRFETEQVRAEREAASKQAVEALDRRQERDIVGATCIGPAPTGRSGTCDRSILQSAKQQGEQPPLCQQHQHLAPNYYLAEAGSKGEDATETRDGVVRREWRAVKMTERQKQQQ